MIKKIYTTVTTDFELDDLFTHLHKYDVIAYDTETTGLNVRKDLIIGASFCGKIGTSFYLPIRKWDGEKLVKLPLFSRFDDVVSALLNKKLVMQNASYDIRITKSNTGVDLLPALHADTQQMVHTFEEEGPFGLKETAIRKQAEIGLDMEKEANEEQLALKANIIKNGGSATKTNYELYKADMEVIATYGAADADITLRLYEYWEKRLLAEGMYSFFYELETMPLYRNVTVPMECNGIMLDIPKIELIDKEITADMQILEADIRAELAPHAQPTIQKILNKHCAISHKGNMAQAVAREYGLDFPLTKTGKFSITAKTLGKVEGDAEAIGFLTTGQWQDPSFKDALEKLQVKLYLKANDVDSVINIQSKDHLASIFFDTLGIDSISKTPTGKPQMNIEMLTALADTYKSAELLLLYNKLLKIKSSYIDRFLREQEDGLFYPRYKQHGTKTGRYGSDLQQLNKPIEEQDRMDYHPLVFKYTNVVREFFIAKPGNVFIDADYESLEPHVFANDAGDEALIDIFTNGFDIYSAVAIQVNGLQDEFSADKSAANYLKKHKPQLRQEAKAYALGIRYGLGDFKLSKTLDISIEEAKGIIDNYFEQFPGLKRAMEECKRQVLFEGKVVSPFGRIRHLPEAKRLYKKYGANLFDPFKTKMLASKHYTPLAEMQQNRRTLTGLLNAAYNFSIQSSAASIVNRAAVQINLKFKEQGVQGIVIAQVHDQLIAEVPENQAELAKKIVQDCMENTTKLKHVTLKAPPELGTTFKDAH